MNENINLYDSQVNLTYQYLKAGIKNIRYSIKNIITNFIKYIKKITSTKIINVEKEFQADKKYLQETMNYFNKKIESREEFEEESCIYDDIINMTNLY